MIKANLTIEASIEENLNTFEYEVNSRFEKFSIDAAQECMDYIKEYGNNFGVVDLGSGDGAASNYFMKNNFYAVSVDINENKLKKIKNNKQKKDILSFIRDSFALTNVFSHHAFEHCVNIDLVIKEIGLKMSSGGIYYVVVPADDYLHSVHHVVFESAEELMPTNFIPLKVEKQKRYEEIEFICVAQKR